MRTYLSVDLDYWLDGRRGMETFMDRVFKLDVPMSLMCSHELVVEHLDELPAFGRVINIDYHSDICHMTPDEHGVETVLNEGTWGGFVCERSRKRFEWRYPANECWLGKGRCDLRYDRVKFGSIYKKPNLAGWESVEAKRGLVGLRLDDVRAVGICLSLSWWYMNRTRQQVRTLSRIFREFGLPFYSGWDTLEISMALTKNLRLRPR